MAWKLWLIFSGLSGWFMHGKAQQDCISGFEVGSIGQSCYHAILESKSWDDAQAMCKASNANLASVTSEKELHFIWDNVISSTQYYYWIGLFKNATNTAAPTTRDDWQWMDGTMYDTSWTIWKTGQPKSDDHYATMYVTFTGEDPHWNGEATGASRHAFICEHSTTSLPSSTPMPSTYTTTSQDHVTTEDSTAPQDPPRSATSLQSSTPIPPTYTTTSQDHVTSEDSTAPKDLPRYRNLAIGLGIGSVVLLIALLGVIIYCVRQKIQRRNSQRQEHEYDEPNPYLTLENTAVST